MLYRQKLTTPSTICWVRQELFVLWCTTTGSQAPALGRKASILAREVLRASTARKAKKMPKKLQEQHDNAAMPFDYVRMLQCSSRAKNAIVNAKTQCIPTPQDVLVDNCVIFVWYLSTIVWYLWTPVSLQDYSNKPTDTWGPENTSTDEHRKSLRI